MAETSNPPAHMSTPTAVVVSPHFLAPYPVDLTIVKKVLSFSSSNFTVTDVNDNVMFRIKGKHISLGDRRVLLDAAGNPIMSFQKKLLSIHKRWVVFKGDSSDSNDIIFCAKQSSLIQLKTSLDVFLGSNEKEDVFDFRVKGSWLDRSCIIFARDGTTIVAQMHKKNTVQSIALGKDTFVVTIYPNVDYAFIVAVIVILHEINDERRNEV